MWSLGHATNVTKRNKFWYRRVTAVYDPNKHSQMVCVCGDLRRLLFLGQLLSQTKYDYLGSPPVSAWYNFQCLGDVCCVNKNIIPTKATSHLANPVGRLYQPITRTTRMVPTLNLWGPEIGGFFAGKTLPKWPLNWSYVPDVKPMSSVYIFAIVREYLPNMSCNCRYDIHLIYLF